MIAIPLVRAGPDRRRHQDRPRGARRDAAAGAVQGAGRPGHRPDRRRAGWPSPATWLSWSSSALIPLLHDAGLLSFPALLVLVAFAGALRGPGDAARGTP